MQPGGRDGESLTPDSIRAALLQVLADIAPEAETTSIKADVSLRDQIDLDSFDLLNFMIAIHERTGVDVPEADYPKVATLDGAVNYVMTRASAGRAHPTPPGAPAESADG